MDSITQGIHSHLADLTDSHAPAISMTSAYDFNSAQEARDRFSGKVTGNVYSRFTNPSVDNFQRKLAIMEGAESAIAFSSGMSAYLALAISFLKQGDHILLAGGIFGTTTHLFREYFDKFGIAATSVNVNDKQQWQKKILPTTKMIIVESPSNPLIKMADIQWLSTLTKTNNIIFVVDNTLLTPVNQNPLTMGADLVLHSTGKFIDGQGRTVGGVIAGRKVHIDILRSYLRSSGTCMSAFDAWILSHSLDTLKARMTAHINNARAIVSWLKINPNVRKVYSTFNSFSDSSSHCPVFSFIIRGGEDTAWRCIDSMCLISRCTNIGDTKTLVTHPATTTHARYTDEEKAQYEIDEGLIRICAGLESSEDIIHDLAQSISCAVNRGMCNAL